MNAKLELSPERVKFWIDIISEVVTKNQNEYNTIKNRTNLLEFHGFDDFEKEYNEWKKNLEDKKAQIIIAKNELDILFHFDKFKDNPKPRLANDYTGEEVQEQIVKRKKIFRDGQSEVPLKNIKWENVIPPILNKENRFMRPTEIWKIIIKQNILEDTEMNHRRFSVSCSSKINSFKGYKAAGRKSYIGMKDWFDENGVPKSEFLNDFYLEKTA